MTNKVTDNLDKEIKIEIWASKNSKFGTNGFDQGKEVYKTG